jgi:hypothetical protein
MINWPQRHRDKASKERRAILLEGATREQWLNGDWPVGAMWLWSLGVVDAPNTAPYEETRRDLQ